MKKLSKNQLLKKALQKLAINNRNRQQLREAMRPSENLTGRKEQRVKGKLKKMSNCYSKQ